MINWLKRYGKSLAAVAGAGLAIVYIALQGDQRLDAEEGVRVAIAVTGAIGVYLVPLAPQYRWAKTGIATLIAALEVLVTVILGGLDPSEVVMVLLAAAAVVTGVAVAPATSANGISARSLAVPPRLSSR